MSTYLKYSPQERKPNVKQCKPFCTNCFLTTPIPKTSHLTEYQPLQPFITTSLQCTIHFTAHITDKMVLDALVISEMGIKVPQMISALCTWTEQRTDDLPEQVLPQGAPTSPILSDIVCQTMDRRLNGLAIRFGLKYSRYADDITFSSQYSVYSNDSDFWQELKCIFDWRGFSINENKTHLLKSCSR